MASLLQTPSKDPVSPGNKPLDFRGWVVLSVILGLILVALGTLSNYLVSSTIAETAAQRQVIAVCTEQCGVGTFPTVFAVTTPDGETLNCNRNSNPLPTYNCVSER